MKVIIPVAGTGTTLRPHTYTQPKPLVPVAGKPILGHIIERLLQVGIQEFVFVIGYMGNKIKDYVRQQFGAQIKPAFVPQEPRMGPGHAIWLCKNYINLDEELLIVFGDTIVEADLKALLQEPGTLVAVQEVEDPRWFGIATLNEEGYVQSLTEKPLIPKSNLALVGVYKIAQTLELFNALQHLIDSQTQTLNEYHLTDALMYMTQKGVQIRTFKVKQWFDCGKKDVLLETNRILLEQTAFLADIEFPNTVFIPPVFIPVSCKISDSIIGPYVALAENVQIKNSIVKDTILGAYANLDSIMLEHSIVGNDTTLKGKYKSINIGDNAEIDFS